VKKQLTKLKKILPNYPYYRGLISTIYKELKNLNTKRINNSINKYTNDSNRKLLIAMQTANKYMKKMFNLFSHQENAEI
jgi:hypothetical protein